MGRKKELQDIFDELGEEEYNNIFLKKRRREQSKVCRKIKPPKINTKYQKEYREDNKEKLSEKKKEYYEDNNNEITRKNWIRRDITFGNINPSEYYDYIFLPTTHCNSCNNEFINNKRDKCLDHIHLPLFCNVRGVLCIKCNVNDSWLWRAHPKSIYSSNYYKQQHEIYIMEKKREFTIENHLDLD